MSRAIDPDNGVTINQKIGSYEQGYRLCTACEEWIHVKDKKHTKRSKNGVLLHNPENYSCGRPLRSTPYNANYRRRFHANTGIKRL